MSSHAHPSHGVFPSNGDQAKKRLDGSGACSLHPAQAGSRDHRLVCAGLASGSSLARSSVDQRVLGSNNIIIVKKSNADCAVLAALPRLEVAAQSMTVLCWLVKVRT